MRKFATKYMRTNKPTETPQQRFDAYLRNRGMRRTVERFALLEQIMNASGHVTAEELQQAVSAAGYPVATATVYSTLKLLIDCGLVESRQFGTQATVYERAGHQQGRHHHLICSVCGKIKEVRDPALDSMIASRHFAGFSQSDYSLNIYGICSSCSRKRRKKS